MLIVSDALKQAFMEPERTIYVRIKIGNRVFDNDDIVSIEYDSGSLSGEVFAIGSTYSNSIKVTFSDLVEGLKELDEVSYEIGIKLPDETIGYVPMGTFIINEAIEMDRNNNKTIIECMDRMVMLGGAYVSSLTYPASIREVALEIANKAGVIVDVTSFERLSADRIAKPEGYTYREAIGLIAQFEAGFATFNRFGKLEIRTLSDPNFAIPPDNYFSKGLVKNEVFFRLGGISCTTDDGDTIIQSGNSAGNQVVLENRVMTKVLLDKIYQKIQTINYYPFSLSWQGNPVLEAGDWVEVEDLQGNKFKTPNLNYSLSFSGGLSAKSSADTTTRSDVTYQYKSPLQQKLEWIQARIDAAGGNVVYEGIDEPANPKEGDLWFKIIGPDKEILVYKKDKDGNLFWDPQISTADINKVAKEIEKIIARADADREAAHQNFEQAVVDAAAYTNTKAREFDTKLLAVNQEVANVTQAADAAVSKADKTIQDVGFMQVDVSAAKTNAATALESANTAKSNASTALTNANSALTKVGALEVTTGSLQTSYNELTKTVGLKADKTTVDGINNKVTQHGLDISANATAVVLKADKTAVDTLKGTVDKHTLDIKAAADGLTLKADSSLVNTIKGTVDTHTTQISANSTAINARLTSAQVETLLTGKKYVNETTLNATANGLSASITQVSSDLNNLEIGGRNLVLGTIDGLTMTGGGATNHTRYPYKFDGKKVAGKQAVITYKWEVISSEVPSGRFKLQTQGNSQWIGFNSVYLSSNNRKGEEVQTYSFNSEASFTQLGIRSDEMFGTIRIYDVKVELGHKATDWTPAPEDMATLEQFTSIDATVKGLQTTVGNKAEQSQVTQLAGQISSKVESSTYNSKMTQLDNAINLRVQAKDVTEAILTDKTVKDTRSTNQLPSWYFANYPKQTVEEFKQRTTMGVPGSATYGQLTTKVLWNSTSGGSITQMFYSSDGVFQRVGNSGATAWLAWDKVAEAGQLLSQINLSTEGVLIQGKRIQLDGDVTMTTAFVTDIKAKSLEAVYADIATLKAKVLTADVITSTMVKSDTALITKLFATDANINILTAKTAFINSVKATTITADKVTGGTANFANFNVINFNAANITSGTVSGANSAWNLNSGLMEFTNPSTGDKLQFTQGQIQFQNGSQGRYLRYNAEGLVLDPFSSNTGTSNNTMLRLQGGGTGSYQYVQFSEGGSLNRQQRLEAVGGNMRMLVADGGEFQVMKYGAETPVNVFANGYSTYHSTGNTLYMTADRIETPRDSRARNIMISPNGTGIVQIANRDGAYYNIRASTFLNASSRRLKTNIDPYTESAMDHLNSLLVVEYNLKKDLADGVNNKQIGFIAEDSPYVASKDMESIDSYKLTALTVKAVQELSAISNTHEGRLATVDKLNADVIRVDTFITQHDLQINKMQEEIEELKEEVQQLKGVA